MRRAAKHHAVLIEGVRSPFVKSFGVFEDCDNLELLSRITEGLLRRLDLCPSEINELIAGAVIPQTKNPNIARDTVLNLGLPSSIHGFTVNRTCASSLQAVVDAMKTIAWGRPEFILAAGVECLSDVPIVYSREARKFMVKLSKAKSATAKLNIIKNFRAKAWLPKTPGLAEPATGMTMGEHAELTAQAYGISRKAQDEFAIASHRKALRARAQGFSAEEIIPLWPPPHYAQCIDEDNLIRADISAEAMASLPAAFDKRYGSVTVGNAAPLSDGAAIALIADAARAHSFGLPAKARLLDFEWVALDAHDELLLGPAVAIPRLLQRHKLELSDIDRFEIHEAFAAQVLACVAAMADRNFCERQLGLSQAFGELPLDRLNVNGGAIALGHPFAASGVRLLTSLANELIRSDKNLGLVAICTAGGMAAALLLERC